MKTKAEKLYIKGYEHYLNFEYDKAIEYFIKALELDSKNPKYYNALGDTYYNILSNPKNDINMALEKGRNVYEKRRNVYEKTIKVYKKAIELDPQNPKYYNNLGNIYFISHKNDCCINYYKKAVDISSNTPQHSQYCANLAYAYYDIESYIEAIKFFEKVQTLKPYIPINHYCLAYAYYKEKQLKKLEIALALHPNNVDYLRHLGKLHYDNKNYKSAIPYLEKVITLDSATQIYLYILANSYYYNNQYKKSIIFFKKLITIQSDLRNNGQKCFIYRDGDSYCPPSPYDYLNFENAYRKLGNKYCNNQEYQKAINTFKDAIKQLNIYDLRLLSWLNFNCGSFNDLKKDASKKLFKKNLSPIHNPYNDITIMTL